MTHPAYNPTTSVKFYTLLTNLLGLHGYSTQPVSYTHLTLPTNREV